MNLKKISVLFLVFLWVTAAYSQTDEPDTTERTGPALVFSETTYDFGILQSDSVVSHIFTFRNTSEDTIKINRVSTH